MAKKDKKADKAKEAENTKTSKTDGKAEKAAEREFKYGVDDIAEALDIKPASVRVQLRNKGIEKAGKSYGWNSQAELKDIVAQLKSKEDAGKDGDAKTEKKSKKDKAEKGADKATEGKSEKKSKKNK